MKSGKIMLLAIWILLVTLQTGGVSSSSSSSGSSSSSRDKIGYFWHIDSLHLDTNFSLDGDRNDFCWNSGRFEHRRLISPLTAPSGPFGDPLCDSPPLLVASAMSFMKDMLADRADFVLWTGNSLPQNPKFELDEEGEEDERRLAALDRVTSIFRLNFPYTTIYPALGNLDFGGESAFGGGGGGDLAGGRHHRRRKRRRRKHRTRNRNKDVGRSDIISNEEGRLLEEVSGLWDTWLPPKAIDSLREGGYYTIELANRRLRLVALNTNLYLSSSSSASNMVNEAAERASDEVGSEKSASNMVEKSWVWLNKTMREARKKKQNVIIFGHSPPGKFERDFSSGVGGRHWWADDHNRRYVHFVREFADVIQAQFFGHQHTDSFRVFRDDRGQAVSWALLNPSVSPYKRSVQVGQRSFSTNPAVRLYRYNTHTGKIFDYAQYYLDLRFANAKAEAKPDFSAQQSTSLWKLEYNFTTHYNLPFSHIHSDTLDALAGKLRTERKYFDGYFRANAVNTEEPDKACSEVDKCRQVQTCAVANVDYDDFRMCVTAAKALSANGTNSAGRIFSLWPMVLSYYTLIAYYAR